MNESLAALQDVIKILKGLGPEALTVVVVIALGYVVRHSPIENRFIPGILPLLGALFYALIASPGEVDPAIRNPELKLAGFGLILGVMGWALHHLVIARIEDKFSKWRSNKTEPDVIPDTKAP
jgi:hypothetical protein